MSVSILVMGLSGREEAAFGFFMGRSMGHLSWRSAPVVRGEVLPDADVIVADLRALGLAQCTPATLAELMRIVQTTPAVLLAPAHDVTWAQVDAVLAVTHTLVWLNKPYTTQAMQAALDKVVASVRPKVVELSVIAPVPRLTSVPIPTPVVAEHPSGLSVGDLQLRLEAPEHLGRHGFLRKLSDLLIQGQPFEARFTVQNSLIVHPEHGWVATNTPMMVIERVCKSDSLASAVDVRPIDSEQAEERLGRLRMTPVELEVFLLALATSTFNS